jgi:tetratricopeptide (TPR) repeat protein
VQAVYDHGRRDVSTFPIATGTYYKVDYSAGVDISKYKNIPVPTSFMAVESKYNFVGGYENDSKAGLLHVANHHISPGKKQWTWGHGDFGRAWDRNLTDEDGPYIEIMCGVYTDNQPDFSWLMPYEERDFRQYFMPYRDLGMVKNATKEALVNLEFIDGTVIIKAYTTAQYIGTTVSLESQGKVILNEKVDFSPSMSYERTVTIEPAGEPRDFNLSIKSGDGKILVDYQPDELRLNPVPEPAKAAAEPADIASAEQLYLTGLHLEQYRHATFNPTDYYLEALRREPGDVRNNNAMGLWLLRHGQFVQAEVYLRRAVDTWMERNPNPYDGEPIYNLGLCLRLQGRNDEAFGKFYKAAWNAAWQDAAYFNLAQLSAIKTDWDEAMDTVNRSLIRNWHNHKARHLKVAILRKKGLYEDALKLADESLSIDGFNLGVLFEKYLLSNNQDILTTIVILARNNIHDYIEFSFDYAMAGMFAEAQQLLVTGINQTEEVYPMAWYFMGWYAMKAPCSFGTLPPSGIALDYFRKAADMDPAYCFPNRLEEALALKCAMTVNPTDSKAPYYLGNFWYHARQYAEAIGCWELSRSLDDSFPTVRRNLALALYNKTHEPAKALFELEAAFKLDTRDARILMELDQLYKKLNHPHNDRLALLEKYPDCVDSRDDLYLERVTLYNQIGKPDIALALLAARNFHPWEGGEGKVTGQYLFARVELARQALSEKNYDKAIFHLSATESFPNNLGEGKLTGTRENDIQYLWGCIMEAYGDIKTARSYWGLAIEGPTEPTAAIFYNDQHPDKIFYQGLALIRLNRMEEARFRFNRLKEFGEVHLKDHVKIDYFAVSLPDLRIWDENLDQRNEINSRYLMGLGLLGLGQTEAAKEQLRQVLSLDVNHQGARLHLAQMQA